MLGGNDRFDDGGQIVHIRQCLDAQNNVVEGVFTRSGFFWGADNYDTELESAM